MERAGHRASAARPIPNAGFRPLAPLLPFTVRQLIAEDRFGPDTEKLLTAPLTGDALVARARWRLYDASASPHATGDLDDGRLQVTSVPLPGTRWTYAIATPETRALAMVRLQSGRNLALALVAAIVAVADLAGGDAVGVEAARARRRRRAARWRRAT